MLFRKCIDYGESLAACCGFPGDDTSPSTESLARSSTYCSRLNKVPRSCYSCFAGVALVADHRENTVQTGP